MSRIPMTDLGATQFGSAPFEPQLYHAVDDDRRILCGDRYPMESTLTDSEEDAAADRPVRYEYQDGTSAERTHRTHACPYCIEVLSGDRVAHSHKYASSSFAERWPPGKSSLAREVAS